jgi:serine/threonine protein phosphatase 1
LSAAPARQDAGKMFGLFGFLKPKRIEARVPDGTRVYAIGDIHGRVDLLTELHEMIQADSARHAGLRKVLVYIGDYVDRGLQSKEVIDLISDRPLAGFEIVHLKGNHEDLMLDFLEDTQNADIWLENGGKATLYSYGVGTDGNAASDERLEAARKLLQENVPKRHLEFLNNLSPWHIEGDYLFVHAGIRPRVSLDDQDDREMLWIRDEFLSSNADHGKTVVHGHSITWKPEIKKNRIGIDTGAFASGILTCLVLQESEQTFLHTDTDAA